MTARKILVSGSSGFVGQSICRALAGDGHQVIRLVRSPTGSQPGQVFWNPAAGRIDTEPLEGIDAVVHLAGENVADRRWSARRKRQIRDSRVEGTRLLVSALQQLEQPPKVLLSASAIGYYGDRGDEELTEESPPGDDFLAQVCREWEEQALAAEGIRVVLLRLGLVLGPGGALGRMLSIFRLGLGGRLGHGRQYMSWISRADVVGIVRLALERDDLRGPINCVAPHPVTNAEFTRTLGLAISRPTIFTAPAFAIRLRFGEMGQSLLLSSTRVKPAKLLKAGFPYQHLRLEAVLPPKGTRR